MVELALSPISPSDLTRDQDLLVGGPGCLPQLRSSCCFWGWLCHLQLQVSLSLMIHVVSDSVFPKRSIKMLSPVSSVPCIKGD
nr:hypothetical protein CFP56_40873 [Quercus suber]